MKMTKEKLIERFHEFLDYSEWLGRVPRCSSFDVFEKRHADFLVHVKQARRGKTNRPNFWCLELDEIAEQRGFRGLLWLDRRIVPHFELSETEIVDIRRTLPRIKVVERTIATTRWNQDQWACDFISYKKPGQVVEVSRKTLPAYDIFKTMKSFDYRSLNKNCRHLIGQSIGCLVLVGFCDLIGEDGTIWFTRHFEKGPREAYVVKKTVLPPIKTLERFLAIKNDQFTPEPIHEGLSLSTIDITAWRFGRWTPIGYSKKTAHVSNKEVVWCCVCDCGNISEICGGKLRSGDTKSCGCLRDELNRVRFHASK